MNGTKSKEEGHASLASNRSLLLSNGKASCCVCLVQKIRVSKHKPSTEPERHLPGQCSVHSMRHGVYLVASLSKTCSAPRAVHMAPYIAHQFTHTKSVKLITKGSQMEVEHVYLFFLSHGLPPKRWLRFFHGQWEGPSWFSAPAQSCPASPPARSAPYSSTACPKSGIPKINQKQKNQRK